MANGVVGNIQQYPLLSPQQQSLQSGVLNQVLSMLKGPLFSDSPLRQGSPLLEGFQPFAQQAQSQFFQKTVPSIAERFTSMGPGAQRSGAFQAALGGAGAGLNENLAALGSQYGLQQQGMQMDLLRLLLGLGMQPSVHTRVQENQPGFFTQAAGGIGSALGALAPLLPFLIPGPGGLAAGAGAGGLGALLSRSK